MGMLECHFGTLEFNSSVVIAYPSYRFYSLLHIGVCQWNNICAKYPPVSSWRISLAILILLIIERNFTQYPIFTDCLICVALVQLYRSVVLYKSIKQALAFFGKHSMNIFLFHTFIFYFWFKEFIYASRNPIIIFALLLSICLILSIGLEWVKKYTINKL